MPTYSILIFYCGTTNSHRLSSVQTDIWHFCLTGWLGSEAPERICFRAYSGCWRKSGSSQLQEWCHASWLWASDHMASRELPLGPFYVAFPSVKQHYAEFFSCLEFLLLPTNQKLSLFSPLCWKTSSWLQEDSRVISFLTLYNRRSAVSCKQISLIF